MLGSGETVERRVVKPIIDIAPRDAPNKGGDELGLLAAERAELYR
jgi:hypothetical protein